MEKAFVTAMQAWKWIPVTLEVVGWRNSGQRVTKCLMFLSSITITKRVPRVFLQQQIYIYHFSKHILGKKKICANSLLYSGKLKSTNIKSWALTSSCPHFTVNLLKWYWSCFRLASTSPIPVKSQAGKRSQKVVLMQLAWSFGENES